MSAMFWVLVGCSSPAGSDATSWWLWNAEEEDTEAEGECLPFTRTGSLFLLFEVSTFPDDSALLTIDEDVLLGERSGDQYTFESHFEQVVDGYTERSALVVSFELSGDEGSGTLVNSDFAGFDNGTPPGIDCVSTLPGTLVRAELSE